MHEEIQVYHIHAKKLWMARITAPGKLVPVERVPQVASSVCTIGEDPVLG